MGDLQPRPLKTQPGIWVGTGPGLRYGFTDKTVSLESLERWANQPRTLTLDQTHSARILDQEGITPNSEGDGIILHSTGSLAVIRTADCTPLFFWDDGGRTAGILHVGWRGYLDRIENHLLDRLADAGISPGIMNFFLGPAIEGGCYEVGDELKETFSHRHLEGGFLKGPTGNWHLDIGTGIRSTLTSRGIPDSRIRSSGICTFCRSGQFASHRREPGHCGRIHNFLFFT